MIDINKGGSAFPYTVANGAKSVDPGMTLRDYFAAKAMQGLLASLQEEDGIDYVWVTRCAYRYADDMLKARES